METVDRLSPRRTHTTLERQIEKINHWYGGWIGYYGHAECPSQFAQIEGHIRRRLRAQLIRAQKQPRNLIRKLCSLGISARQARQIAYRPYNIWRKSITNGAHRAWSNNWFSQRGFKAYSTARHPHWAPLDTKVVFP